MGILLVGWLVGFNSAMIGDSFKGLCYLLYRTYISTPVVFSKINIV